MPRVGMRARVRNVRMLHQGGLEIYRGVRRYICICGFVVKQEEERRSRWGAEGRFEKHLSINGVIFSRPKDTPASTDQPISECVILGRKWFHNNVGQAACSLGSFFATRKPYLPPSLLPSFLLPLGVSRSQHGRSRQGHGTFRKIPNGLNYCRFGSMTAAGLLVGSGESSAAFVCGYNV